MTVFIYRKCRIPFFIVKLLLFVITLLMLQAIKFSFLPYGTYIGIILKIIFAFFALEILKKNFIPYYVNIIYFFTILSFFFYFSSYIPALRNIIDLKLSPLFKNPFIDYSSGYKIWPNVIVYTSNPDGYDLLLRNSGPFWEPGAFAGFLVIGLIFNFLQTKNIWHKKNLVLMTGLVTTLSTTGILALFVIIAGYLLSNQRLILKVITLPILLLLGFVGFNSVDFLGSKVTEKMDIENAEYNTRFKSAVLDIEDTMENPILGLGRNIKTRFKGETDPVKIHRNNGVTDVMASMGLMAFFLYFYFIFYSFSWLCKVNNFNNEFAYYAIILIIMIGFSEGYFFRPFFYSLTMLHVYIRIYHKEENHDKN